jgi:GntR family transcriptional repressor for pyruvate dehydrogenase complex
LAGEIRMGKLEPGAKLTSERGLCERFGASRSSVREALRVLNSRGMIDIQVGRGSFVSDFTAPATDSPLLFWEHNHETPLVALLEVRFRIEPHIAYLAAQRSVEENLETLRMALDNLRLYTESDRLGGRVFADIAFHDALVRAAGNELYLSVYRSLEPILFDVRRMGLRSTERSLEVLGMHARIYEAVRDHDPEEAAAAMRSHLLAFAEDMGVEIDRESLYM